MNTRLSLFCTVLLLSLQPRSFVQAKDHDPKSPVDFLRESGFSSVRLQRTIYHLVITAKINGHPARLVIATNNPISQIDRKLLPKFQVKEEPYGVSVTGGFGGSQPFGLATVKTLAISKSVLHDVPVAIVNLNIRQGVPGYDGVFALADCQRIGAVIDCDHRVMYFNPGGPDRKASQNLRVRLTDEGFSRVPLRVKSQAYLEASCAINGHPLGMLVALESFATVLTTEAAERAGVHAIFTPATSSALGGRVAALNRANVEELSIGDFKIPNANLNVARSQTSNLGIDHLEFCHAIIDLGGLALYLKH